MQNMLLFLVEVMLQKNSSFQACLWSVACVSCAIQLLLRNPACVYVYVREITESRSYCCIMCVHPVWAYRYLCVCVCVCVRHACVRACACQILPQSTLSKQNEQNLRKPYNILMHWVSTALLRSALSFRARCCPVKFLNNGDMHRVKLASYSACIVPAAQVYHYS